MIREAFGTNSVAQAAATAALGDVEHVRRSVELNREREGAPRRARSRERGFRVLPSLTNFVTFDTRRSGRERVPAAARARRDRAAARPLPA